MPQTVSLALVILLVIISVTVAIYVLYNKRSSNHQDRVSKDTFTQMEIHRRVFPDIHPSDRRLLNVIYDNYLAADGDLLRRAHITLQVVSNEFSGFKWRIPHLVQWVRPFGISVTCSVKSLPFQVEHYDDKQVTEVWIPFHEAKEGDVFTFTIEYIQEHYATLLKQRFLWNEWRFDWVYSFVSPTDYFEMRVHFPKTSRLNLSAIRNSLTKEEHISKIGDEVLYISSHTNPGNKPASGSIPYQVWSPALPATISLAAGVILALPFTLVGQVSWQGSILVFMVVSLGVFVAHRLTESVS